MYQHFLHVHVYGEDFLGDGQRGAGQMALLASPPKRNPKYVHKILLRVSYMYLHVHVCVMYIYKVVTSVLVVKSKGMAYVAAILLMHMEKEEVRVCVYMHCVWIRMGSSILNRVLQLHCTCATYMC